VKIAVATMDGVSVSQHFGQSRGFVVFEVEGTSIKSRELRTNSQTPHGQGICNHDGGHRAGSDSHGTVLDLLGDCQFVLCGGMGAGAAQVLRSYSLEPLILPGPYSAEEAVESYVNGSATPSQSGLCSCHH